MKTLLVRITFDPEDGSFDDEARPEPYGADALHEALMRAYPWMNGGDFSVVELEEGAWSEDPPVGG